MNRILLIPTLFTIAACATPGIEPGQAETAQEAEFAPTTESTLRSEPAHAKVMSDDDVLPKTTIVQNDTRVSTGGIQVLEAPKVSETPAAMIPGRVEPEDQIVCERVTPTGSKISKKVCRDKAEVARKSEYDQDMFDDIKRNTAIGNILNMCGLSVPCGFTKQGLPIGLMVYAKPFQENLVLRAGYAFQQTTDWHRRGPDLSWVVK